MLIIYMEISFKFNGHLPHPVRYRIQHPVRYQIQHSMQCPWIQFQAPMMVTTFCLEAPETISFMAEEVMPISYEARGAMTPCSATRIQSEMC